MDFPLEEYMKFMLSLLLLLAVPLGAQLRLHDPTRESLAQDAKKTVEKIRAGESFKRQAENARILMERDVATALADAKVEMKNRIHALRAWSDVTALLEATPMDTDALTPAEIQQLKDDIKARRENLEAQIKRLRGAAEEPDNPLEPLVEQLGQIESVLKFADADLGLGGPLLTDARKAIGQLEALYGDYEKQFAAVNKAATALSTLKINMKKALLARLKLEEDAITAEVALHTRRAAEMAPVRVWRNRCRVPAGVPESELIDETLNRLAVQPQALTSATSALFGCASYAAAKELPGRLFELRRAHLRHRYSIQMSAANSKVYEAALGGGVERLALYYSTGVKPAAVAQIIQSFAAVGIFGKLLSQ
jgi:hypothetical protein